jgi:eukaryotic-like serine/threonine-protein kinase
VNFQEGAGHKAMATGNTKKLPSAVAPGAHLDHYRIEGIVAESSLATIVRATDLRDNRVVAIKIPRPEAENEPTFADWFRREEEIGAHLDHPGVMKVIADPDRTGPYLVMEWFEGKPLRQILNEEKRIPLERAVRIVVGICGALEYIHARGIVHRDLRPENILVGAGDHVMLIDFGGAAKTAARRLTMTRVAQMTGASNYVSPEELMGKRGDSRSDIYSLGMILYEMLTGVPPFPAAKPFDRLLHYPVPPRELDPAISPQIQEVIYRAMERDPKNRTASAHELAMDLEHLDQVGVVDRPELREWKNGRATETRKILLYLALVLLPILIFGLLLYFARH